MDGQPDALAAVLRQRHLEVEVDGLRLVVTRPRAGDDDLYDVVRDAVVTSGVGLRRLTDRTVSLEDVFLEVGT